MLKRFFTAAIVLVAIGIIIPLTASAQESDQSQTQEQKTTSQSEITLTPVDKRYDLDAGAQVEDHITVVNTGDTAFQFIVYSRPYSVNNEQYDPNFEQVLPNTDVYSWIQFEQTEYSLKPGERIDVAYTLRVPAGAAPGGHYGVIFAETQPDDSLEVIARKKRVGSIVYANIAGEAAQEGSIKSVDSSFWQKPPITTDLRVENSGNTDFIVESTYKVKNIFGSTVYETNRNSPVLPSTTRLIDFAWADAPAIGLYSYELDINFLNNQETRSGYVLLMPIWIPIVLGLLIIAGVAYAITRRYRC